MRVPLNHWYPVLEPREVRCKPVTVERLGVKLVFWRSSAGVLHAQRDRCPHLGASLGTAASSTTRWCVRFMALPSDLTAAAPMRLHWGATVKIPKGLGVETFVVREAHIPAQLLAFWPALVGATGGMAHQLIQPLHPEP